MTLLRRLRNASQRLHWQLTISYMLVTVAALLMVEVIAFGGFFLFLSSDVLPRQLQRRAAQAIVPQVRPHMTQRPIDRSALQEALGQLARGQYELAAESEEGATLRFGLTDTGEAFAMLAVDTAGTIVAAADATSLVGRPVSVAYPGVTPAVERALSGDNEKLFARLPDDRLGLSIPVTAGDDRIVGAVLVVDAFPTNGGNFVADALPVLLQSALVLTVVAGVIGTGFGFLTARRLTGRFEALARAADAWSRGNFTIRVEDSSPDEIGQLARHLNRMSEQLENLLHTRKRLTRLETRNQLAQDLHDSVKQQVFATAMQIGAARNLVGHDNEQAQVHLDNAHQLVTEAQQELKALIHEMRPAALDGRGLAAALRNHVDGWSRQQDIAADVHVRGERETPLPVEQTLYRVAQEALANVAKHSGAGSVDVTLTWDAERYTLRVADDGRGFVMDERATVGFGLDNMRQRVAALDGTVEIASMPGAGTTITVTVPVQSYDDLHSR